MANKRTTTDMCVVQPSMIPPTTNGYTRSDGGVSQSGTVLLYDSGGVYMRGKHRRRNHPTGASSSFVASKPWHPRIKRHAGGQDDPFKLNERFMDRWLITGIIGKGGFGTIFHAYDLEVGESVSIKTEPSKKGSKVRLRIILEQKVLYRLQGCAHVARMWASGHTLNHNYIVMQLLSVNVGDLKKQSPANRLSKSTTARILQQGIAALRDLHMIGYLHRDIKPANMAFGVTPKSRHVLYLLDFGLVRRFRQKNGEFRPPRSQPGFRGTMRYASPRTHARYEQAPVDDLISLAYSGYELLACDLPWKYLSESIELYYAKNKFMKTREYPQLISESFADFCMIIYNLPPCAMPNYTVLQGLIQDMVGYKAMEDPYDWEESYKELIIPCPAHPLPTLL